MRKRRDRGCKQEVEGWRKEEGTEERNRKDGWMRGRRDG